MSGSKQLAEQLDAVAEQLGMTVVPKEPGNGWAKAAHAVSDSLFLGVSVPIKVETPGGSVKCFIALPPEVMANPENLVNAIKRLIEMGIPVDVYAGRQDNGWQRNGGGNGGGGGQWSGNRNGYGGGGGGYNGGNGNGYSRGGRW